MLPYKPEKAEALDVDSNNQVNLLSKYFTVRHLFGEASVKVSPSGEGYHIYNKTGYTYKHAEALGDCKGRLHYWSKQGYTFTFKAKGEKREEEFNILSREWWSQHPARKVRK